MPYICLKPSPMDTVLFEDDPAFIAEVLDYFSRHMPENNLVLITDRLDELLRYAQNTLRPCVYLLDLVIGRKVLGIAAGLKINRLSDNNKIIFITEYAGEILFYPEPKIIAYSIVLKQNPDFFQELAATVHTAGQKIHRDTLIVYNDRFKYIAVAKEEIRFIETIKGTGKIRIHHKQGIFNINMGLGAVLEMLDQQSFYRCHYSFIVNKSAVRGIDRKRKIIHLHGGAECSYSYRKGKALLTELQKTAAGG